MLTGMASTSFSLTNNFVWEATGTQARCEAEGLTSGAVLERLKEGLDAKGIVALKLNNKGKQAVAGADRCLYFPIFKLHLAANTPAALVLNPWGAAQWTGELHDGTQAWSLRYPDLAANVTHLADSYMVLSEVELVDLAEAFVLVDGPLEAPSEVKPPAQFSRRMSVTSSMKPHSQVAAQGRTRAASKLVFQEVVEVIPEAVEEGGPRRTTRETSLRFKSGVEVIP